MRATHPFPVFDYQTGPATYVARYRVVVFSASAGGRLVKEFHVRCDGAYDSVQGAAQELVARTNQQARIEGLAGDFKLLDCQPAA